MPKISVIVPVYNGEKHIRDCLDSLLRQTLRDIEVLAVNNGSSDNSGAILAEYASVDERIKVLTLNPNQGPSGGRNAALDAAAGEFIAFCDCDDQVPEDAYENVYKNLIKNKADIIVGNYVEITADGTELIHREFEEDKEAYNSYLKGGALWNKVFRKRLIEGGKIRFLTSARYAEDTLFLAEVLNLNPVIIRTSQIIYKYYRYSDNTSQTKHFTADHIKYDMEIKTQYFSLLSPEKYPNLTSLPINTLRSIYRNVWKWITDPEEKKAGFYYMQKFVAEHYMKERDLFFKCFCVTQEVFSQISFEDYMDLLDKINGGYPFKFSVIVPIYNTEKYLEETVKSVINQSIGFQENVQMILVNNATEDNSEKICKRFHALYPDNIVYVKLEKNVGPAGAREAGKKYATGKYINFLDSDDKWSRTAFEKAWFFLEAYPDIDLVACRVYQFDAVDKWHVLDYKFLVSCVVDIRKNCDYVQLHVGSTFIRTEAAKNHSFETDLHHAEDAQYINQIILEKCKYGVLREAVYQYRARSGGGSLLQDQANSREYYVVTPVRVFQWMLDYAKQRPEVLTYVQHVTAYDLQWRLTGRVPNNFSADEKEEYRTLLRTLMQEIDDEIIWKLHNVTNCQKINILYFKYGDELKKHISTTNGVIYGYGIEFEFLSASNVLELEIMELSGNQLSLYGRVLLPAKDNICRVCLFDGEGNEYPFDMMYEAAVDGRAVMQNFMWTYNFSVHIELQKEIELFFAAITDDGIYPIEFSCGRRFPLTRELSHSHCCQGSWHFHSEGHKLIVRKRGFLFDLKKQLGLWIELFKKKKRTAFLCHIYIYLRSLLPKKRQIWLISDRASIAGDNGETLFRYVNSLHNSHVKAYFSIRSDSSDYKRIKKYGKAVRNDSGRYMLLYLRADKVISSNFDAPNIDPLGKHEEFLKDLIQSRRIFLQHGVTKDDSSESLNKIKWNFSGFVTSASAEYSSLLSPSYGYNEDEVWLTGFARHDAICNCVGARQKRLFIAPTWRQYFSFVQWGEDGLIVDCDELLETEYYQFYSALINDTRLLDIMRKYEYEGVFCLHPIMMHFAHHFKGNDVFRIEAKSQNYGEEVKNSSLYVTDYSSVAFEFAYAYRSCIYTQFDKDIFTSNHTYKPGYFDYERDGFGPVCRDYESTVQAIIHAIENGCVMEEKYHKRAEKFFAYRDGKCCERIYQEILKLED